MEKQECKEAYENHNLIMCNEKCNNCQYLYECRYMIAEIDDILGGDSV